MLSQNSLTTVLLGALVTVAILSYTKLTTADDEFDKLTLQFQNGIGLVSNKMGYDANSAQQPITVDIADQKMRDLYSALERNLMDARQRAANTRSSLTSSTIERLKLV